MADNRYGHPYYLRPLVICCLLTILSGIIFSQIEFQREGSGFCLNRAQKRSEIIPDCKRPNYKARILMYEPFMMHIENFVSPEERAHLLQLGYGPTIPFQQLS